MDDYNYICDTYLSWMKEEQEMIKLNHVYVMELPWTGLKQSKICFNALTNEFYLMPYEGESVDDMVYIGCTNDPWSEIVRNAEIYDERIM